MAIRIVPFDGAHVPDAARMFVAGLSALRLRVPALSGDLENVDAVSRRLDGMGGVAALEGDRLVGYLAGWFPIERFRDTHRAGAYVPEWAHGAVGENRRAVSNALYRAASATWSQAGCEVHAITLLAGDDAGLETWFWSGFGMGTIDAVRRMQPVGITTHRELRVRRATPYDAPALAQLDVEHRRHHSEAPVFMAPRMPDDARAWEGFLSQPGSGAWLAEDAAGPFGFMQFGREFEGSSVVESATGIFISGAYVRATRRGRGAATAMLDAAISHYADAGMTTCAVDFEAFNPEASAFWMRHFTPVCHSLMRVPESPTG